MKRILFIILVCASFVLNGQNTDGGMSDTGNYVSEEAPISAPFFSLAAGETLPLGDMRDLYKPFFNINGMLGWKTSENWVVVLDFCFQFGSNNIRNIDDILAGLMTADKNPFIVGADGTDAGVVGYNRNLSLSFGIGKVIPVSMSRKNSGILLTLNAGYLQHQIIYEATQSRVFQLEDDYKYGYDRQRRGYLFSMFAGYMHLSKKAYANWSAGTQIYYARTKMTREYQFDMYDANTGAFFTGKDKYNDCMITFKVGWIIPFLGRSSNKIYYF